MNSILAALVNGMLVSAVLAFAVWVAMRLLPRNSLNAAARYAVWWVVLVVMAGLPFWYLRAGAAQPVEAPSFIPPAVPTFLSHAPVPGTRPVLESEPSLPVAANSTGPRQSPRIWPLPALPITIPAGPWPARILAVWFLTSGLMLIRLGVSALMLERRKARALEAPPLLAERVARWSASCVGPNRRVRVANSCEISVPQVVGPWHPAILFPSRLLDEMSERDLEQIGIHEAAHVFRRDDYALFIQRMLEAVFALHPVVHWVSRRIDLEREIACDDLVIAATGNAKTYATCLARVVELSGGVRGLPTAAAVADGRSHLAKRVEMLLDNTRYAAIRFPGLRLGIAVVCVTALAWGAVRTRGVLAFAQPQLTFAAPAAIESPAPISVPQAKAAIAPVLPQIALLAQNAPPVAPPAFPSMAQADVHSVPNARDASMVFVPVEVTDPLNRFVTGLEQDVFTVQEDGVEQTITQLLTGDTRTDVFILVDPRLGPDAHRLDQYNFGGANAVVIPYDVGQHSVLDTVRTIGRSNRGNSNDRRAMLILTTSLANANYTEADMTTTVRDLDMPVYTCELINPAAAAAASQEAMPRSPLLTALASQTGGRHIAVSRLEDLPDALNKVLISLRNMYVLGYTPSNTARDGAYRSLRVSLNTPRGLPPLTAHSRPGYIAPAQ